MRVFGMKIFKAAEGDCAFCGRRSDQVAWLRFIAGRKGDLAMRMCDQCASDIREVTSGLESMVDTDERCCREPAK